MKPCDKSSTHMKTLRKIGPLRMWCTTSGSRFMIAGIILSLWVIQPVSAFELGSATEALKQTIDKVLVVLANETFKSPDQAQARIIALEEAIAERFDYQEMGKRTLSHHWKKLSDEQRQEFIELFRHYLSHTYAGNIDGYAGEQVEYLKERRKGDFAEVQTKVTSPNLQIPLDYRLLKKTRQWRVYDVIIDGISLVKNFRGQFNRIIQSSSYEGLLSKLREKTQRKPG
ncbi:MAG: ABC transporter substrate-binding protein [Nitrospirales bacterium]|nr:ABC transporter substrate-binding protein [Nitrospirales bacterium]